MTNLMLIMTPIEINNQLRSKAFGLAAIVAGIMALGAIISGQWLMFGISVIFCSLLLVNSQINKASQQQKAQRWLANLVVLFLVVVSLVSIAEYNQTAEQWCYLLPLVAFFIYNIQVATCITALFSVAVAIALIGFYQGPEKIQIFFIYLLSLAMTLAFIYLREIKENQLKPLRRTDNLTLASTWEYLTQDLEKEVQRSEREGTDLSVLALSFDKEFIDQVPRDQIDMLLHHLGRLLHQNLRLFDSYYRYEDADFIIILPHTGSKEASRKASQLLLSSRQKLSTPDQTVSVSIGIATLNAGDSGNSLIRNCRHALKVARTRGSNQTVAYLDIINEENAIAG
jgi:diguanylate cyclase (GGDEF)-like protein